MVSRDTSNELKISPGKRSGTFLDYLSLARFDHVTKQVFIVPGIAFAFLLRNPHSALPIRNIVFGFLAAICVASANYVLNEWLDRDFDRFHPSKSKRVAVQCELRGGFVIAEWSIFLVLGLCSAAACSTVMIVAAGILALQGLAYNVPPVRTKDKPYLDVLSESINNPLRLLIGWAMVDSTTLPPSSIILAYWFGGAFLMAAKRLSEYREIVAYNGKKTLAKYRASFAGYTETSLNVSCFVYGLLSSFSLAVFLIRYRIEYILVMPLIIVMFGYYLALSMQAGSSAQNPEKLYREGGLILVVAAVVGVFVFATLVDLPVLNSLTAQRFISLR
jgi:4-hydroxybenzoate polyprenyltransferase